MRPRKKTRGTTRGYLKVTYGRFAVGSEQEILQTAKAEKVEDPCFGLADFKGSPPPDIAGRPRTKRGSRFGATKNGGAQKRKPKGHFRLIRPSKKGRNHLGCPQIPRSLAKRETQPLSQLKLACASAPWKQSLKQMVEERKT